MFDCSERVVPVAAEAGDEGLRLCVVQHCDREVGVAGEPWFGSDRDSQATDDRKSGMPCREGRNDRAERSVELGH